LSTIFVFPIFPTFLPPISAIFEPTKAFPSPPFSQTINSQLLAVTMTSPHLIYGCQSLIAMIMAPVCVLEWIGHVDWSAEH
jgi:hypothetical protein